MQTNSNLLRLTNSHTLQTKEIDVMSRSDGRRSPHVAELGGNREVEVVDGVAAVGLQEAGQIEKGQDGQLERDGRPQDPHHPATPLSALALFLHLLLPATHGGETPLGYTSEGGG